MKLYPNNVIDMIKVLPSTQSVLIRGPHGIGKSQVAKLVGALTDRPVIDLRLSQLTEGDFLGLPKILEAEYDKDGNIIRQSQTDWRPPSWFIQACEQPCVLFLDEINRAVMEVMQCAFQLVLDRAIQGKHVHDGTLIVAAINATQHYQVNEMDPALLDRFLVVDMVPNIKPWKKWALEAGIEYSIIEFCEQHPDHWWHDPTKNLEPGKVYPTPRSWEMVNNCLHAAGLFEKPESPVFKHIITGLIGTEAGAAFYDFVKNYDRNITASDVLDNYKSVSARVKRGMPAEQILSINDKIVHHCRANEWTDKNIENLRQYIIDVARGELNFTLWTKINAVNADIRPEDRRRAQKNALNVHKRCHREILDIVRLGDNLQGEQSTPEPEQKSTSTKKKSTKKKKTP